MTLIEVRMHLNTCIAGRISLKVKQSNNFKKKNEIKNETSAVAKGGTYRLPQKYHSTFLWTVKWKFRTNFSMSLKVCNSTNGKTQINNINNDNNNKDN